MEEIGATIPKYQPLQVVWRSLCDYARQTILSHPIRPFTRELIPSLFEESIAQSSLKSVQPVFCYGLIKSFLSPQKFLRVSRFFFFFFFHFHHTLFRGLAGSLRDLRNKLSFCTFTCLSNNLLISSWIPAKFVSALLPCMLNLSHYFQPDVQTLMYLREAITLQVDT